MKASRLVFSSETNRQKKNIEDGGEWGNVGSACRVLDNLRQEIFPEIFNFKTLNLFWETLYLSYSILTQNTNANANLQLKVCFPKV